MTTRTNAQQSVIDSTTQRAGAVHTDAHAIAVGCKDVAVASGRLAKDVSVLVALTGKLGYAYAAPAVQSAYAAIPSMKVASSWLRAKIAAKEAAVASGN